MSSRCRVCGRTLHKSIDIGPTCLRKGCRRKRLTKIQKIALATQFNLFKEKDANGSEKIFGSS